MTNVVTPTQTYTHKVIGTKAYIETVHGGLVPCIILGYDSCEGFFKSKGTLVVQIERTIGAYTKGEITTSSKTFTPPRDRIRKSQFHNYVQFFRYEPYDESLVYNPANSRTKGSKNETSRNKKRSIRLS